ncbi:MAG: tRNA-dihydrouridine synthase family protein [Candidatus Kerfeldbacteria bacterium]|nr:tRNA-dihydrouridine synthase family protein [Candidatus Kerfeldbacteria bacterium]
MMALAPMEGVTDAPFRAVAKRFGADVVYTEFISAEAIVRGSQTARRKMAFQPIEQPIVCQIFGRDAEVFRRAAHIVQAHGFAGLDINFGCPAHKVVGHGAGVALLRDPAYARKLIEAVLGELSIPLSIKVRTSIHRERREIKPADNDCHTAVDLVKAIKDLPVAAIMIHGRSFEHGFDGTVDTAMIKAVAEQFPGIVLANGGIRTPDDAARMLGETGADGLGIARGALGRPWIFQQVKDYLQHKQVQSLPGEAVFAVAAAHAAQVAAGGQRALIEFRKHLGWYLSGRPGAARARRQLATVNALDDVHTLLAQLPA